MGRDTKDGKQQPRKQGQRRNQEIVTGAREVESKEKQAGPRTVRGNSKQEQGPEGGGSRWQAEGGGTIQRDEKTEDLALKWKKAGRFGVLGKSLRDKQLLQAPGFRGESEGMGKGRRAREHGIGKHGKGTDSSRRPRAAGAGVKGQLRKPGRG